jgi:Leucine-rich repeat (LRR) protein
VSCLQSSCALQTLDLSFTHVTDAGIRGLELVRTLEVLNLAGCDEITDVSCLRLQSCRALKKLDLSQSSVTDAGIRGLSSLSRLRYSTCHIASK